jgi:hypothetical protein
VDVTGFDDGICVSHPLKHSEILIVEVETVGHRQVAEFAGAVPNLVFQVFHGKPISAEVRFQIQLNGMVVEKANRCLGVRDVNSRPV